MFGSVLVANRGEIAVRVVRTLRRLGVRSAAVYSSDDAGARHVREADAAVRLPGGAGAAAYLDGDALVAAARAAGAEAVHPGYGFLAENAGFAAAVEAAGLVWVGPPASAVELMGDKIRAKEAAERAGVPVVSGSGTAVLDDAGLAEAAAGMLAAGTAVLLKPSAGGGGKGMRVVRAEDGLAEAIAAARREARASFGDDTLMVERLIEGPRHIEVQVLADRHGRVVHLGERECSLQRRHQKVVEEAPSPLLAELPEVRARMGADAVRVARECGYTGAGTVEFIVPGGDPGAYAFMEMNTRLQVEHPVTEFVTGLDLVEWQLRVAAGEALPEAVFDQGALEERIAAGGHAVEARVCAEDASRGFLPTGGRVLALAEPSGDGVRVDSGLDVGAEVGSEFDPMLAKVVAHGADRPEALRRLRAALAGWSLLGVVTNAGFVRGLLADSDVAAGRLDTGLVERVAGVVPVPCSMAEVLVAAAVARQSGLAPVADGDGWVDPFAVPSGWRPGGTAWTVHELEPPAGPGDGGEGPVEVRVRPVRGDAGAFEVVVGGGEPSAVRAGLDGGVLAVERDGVRREFSLAVDDGSGVVWLGREGWAWPVRAFDAVDAGAGASGAGTAGAGGGRLLAPMPGTVGVLKAAEGDLVAEGQTVLVVEAMKMEHPVVAPVAGRLVELRVRAGARVAMDEVLAVVEPDGGASA
ncbi:acetyl/propionyl-CoA carboxylase subuit alpha [Mangrovactinospora gilvigrisea]|uniref:biotin carboxylase n=1 Tax=Mangrovactinospora gilvigrisea TaxID=1428644 RepID=A0A1J7C8X9_9ACTN|nr:biotin carboxylase N-terminal domain-containing protein [Mangrovactinospora gilvigrisea]OIV36074.1 acetyl/propionyl-CoA carboxylase subuit alpha [Mangrovactinospora gilvigrisea]